MSRHPILYLSTEVIHLIDPEDHGNILMGFQLSEADDDLMDNMQQVAKSLLERDDEGRCGIWLPRDQLRIISAPFDESAPSVDAQITRTLEEATPYKIEDLSYNYAIEHGTLWIIAVAKVTIGEAKSFANSFGLLVEEIGAHPNIGHYPADILFWSRSPKAHAAAPTAPPSSSGHQKKAVSRPLIAVAALFALLVVWLSVSVFMGEEDPEQLADAALYEEDPENSSEETLASVSNETISGTSLDALRDTLVSDVLDTNQNSNANQIDATQAIEEAATETELAQTDDGLTTEPTYEITKDGTLDPLSIPDVTASWSSPLIAPLYDITQMEIEGEVYAASIDPKVNTDDPTGLPPQSEVFRDQAHRALPNPSQTTYDRASNNAALENTASQGTAPQSTATLDDTAPQTAPLTDEAPQDATPEDAASVASLSEFLAPMVRPEDFDPTPILVADIPPPSFRPEDFSIQDAPEVAQLVEMKQPQWRPTDFDIPQTAPPQEVVTATEEDNNLGGVTLAMLEPQITKMMQPKFRPSNFASTVKSVERSASAQENIQARITTRPTASPRSGATPAANAATQSRGIKLNKDTLIGIYGTKSRPHALMRTSRGRYVKLRTGDRFDGGKVAAIGDRQLRLVKGSRNIVYKLP